MLIRRFNELNINLGVLEDPIAGGGVRGDKLVSRLKSNDDFTIAKDGDEKKVRFINHDEIVDDITDQGDNYNKQKSKDFFTKNTRYKPVLKGQDQEDYKLNDIKKDAEFGRGSGTSLGIDKTREVESIQCLFFALKRKIEDEIIREHLDLLYDANGEVRQDLLEQIRVPIQITGEYLRTFFENDQKNWLDTFINTTNALYHDELQLVDKEKTRTVFKNGIVYQFHQIGCDSELIKSISVAYDNPESKNIPIPKWTPSDVWAVDIRSESDIIQELRNCVTVKELNGVINRRFKSGQLIGISLKKVGGKESINLVINNLTPAPNFTLDKVIISSDPLGASGVRLIAKVEGELVVKESESMYIRSFAGPNKISNISGEVEGVSSQYGKIGLGWINLILGESGVPSDEHIPSATSINQDESKNDDVLKSEIRTMSGMFPDKSKVRNMTDPFTGVKGPKTISGRGSLISKYQALKLAMILERYKGVRFEDEDNPKSNKLVSDKIVEDMFLYALAIKNYTFECPMYVRIISGKRNQ
jgi:hypothetical protein